MKVLVIAAHPDDEVLGVGGTICKHVENMDEVYICIVTKAYEPEWSNEYIKQKLTEQKQVDQLLHVKKRYNLDFPTIKLNTIPHGMLNNALKKVIEEVEPDIIYTHFEDDLNQDHRIIFHSTMVVARPPRRIKVLSYEILSSTELSNSGFNPNYYIDIKKYLSLKIEAFRIYSSEVKKLPHSRSLEGVELLSKYRGIQVSLECAEAFIIKKDYWIL
ncbi:MAG: PIG-L family deacetylase [Candidatus Lokiarchaeota archaeon]|nr:PIG-L family deacetylase [Candidatus Lokiarchaeota archaeon]